MVELEAKELSEALMLEAVMTGHRGFQPVIDAIIKLAEKAAKEPRDLVVADKSDVEAAVRKIAEAELREAYKITAKQERYNAVDAVKAKVLGELFPEGGEAPFSKSRSPRSSMTCRPRLCAGTSSILAFASTGATSAGTVRPILAEVGVLPRTHGSALFTRGET